MPSRGRYNAVYFTPKTEQNSLDKGLANFSCQLRQMCNLPASGRIEMAKDAEERISKGVLAIAAAHPKGRATFRRCRTEIPNHVNLTAGDLAPSTTRPGEPMWHQIVRNIKSHAGEENNCITLSYLTHVPRIGYEITAAGLKKAKN